MIKIILIGITLLLTTLLIYTQMQKEPEIKKHNNDSIETNIQEKDVKKYPDNVTLKNVSKKNSLPSIPTTASEHTSNDEMSELNAEMAENEKEIIKRFLTQKEDVTVTYNAEEEEDIPTEPMPSLSDEKHHDLSAEELDTVEKESHLQPNVVDLPYIDEDTQENTPITEKELENAEIDAGMQETLEDNSEPLDAEDIPF